jgi:hypothetical protein
MTRVRRDLMTKLNVVRLIGAGLASLSLLLVGAVAAPAGATASSPEMTWTTPTTIDHLGALGSVSCVSTSWCMAADTGGNILHFNGLTWSPPQHVLNAPIDAVSCASAKFCAATTDDGHISYYRGTSWSAAANVNSGERVIGLSCPLATFCMGVDGDGAALHFNGTTWSGAVEVGMAGMQTVSCPSAKFCVAGDWDGGVWTWWRLDLQRRAVEQRPAQPRRELPTHVRFLRDDQVLRGCDSGRS